MPPRHGKVAEAQALSDDVELTQYGEDGDTFRNTLREEIGETEMSLLMGRQTAMAAALLVTKTVSPRATVRHTTVGMLRTHRFIVQHSPTRGNALHVSVLPPPGDLGPTEWDKTLADSFDECFAPSGEGCNDE